MQDHRTETAITLEQDPASGRLNPDDVITIHRAHRDGVPWAEIASMFGIRRQQVARIVQGRRWSRYHPQVRPDLYTTNPTDTPTVKTEVSYSTADLEKAMEAAMEAFRRTLNSTGS